MKTYSKTDKWVGQSISFFILGAVFISFQNMAPNKNDSKGAVPSSSVSPIKAVVAEVNEPVAAVVALKDGDSKEIKKDVKTEKAR